MTQSRWLAGGFAHVGKQGSIDARHVTRQYQQVSMPRCFQASTNPGQRPWKVTFIVMHQLVGVGGVLFLIAVAGNDQVVAQGASQGV